MLTQSMQVGTGPRTRMLSTQGLTNMRDNIVTVFGSRTAEALVALDGTLAEGLSMHGYAFPMKQELQLSMPLLRRDRAKPCSSHSDCF